ncbi:hypothetical protein [Halomonas salifodinae]|uniref:hypothetical protein n=1 Tax=Halomonas salifodinae TaxID=438745 RepID=UPI0033B4653F
MNRRLAFPFLTLSDAVVEAGGWMIGDPDKPLFPCESLLENWDYDRDLQVARQLTVDVDGATEALGLTPGDLRMKALLKVGTGRGSTPRTILETVSVPLTGDGHVSLVADLEASRLSTRLWMETSLVLGDRPVNPGAMSPTQPGSRLWSSSFDVLLEEGGDSRLPMETISFSQAFSGRMHEHSLWYLAWRPHAWESDFVGSVRLYLNRDREDFLQQVLDGESFHLHMIMTDVMTQLISAYVVSDVGDTDDDHGGGTLARQSRDWLELAFPGLSVKAVKALFEDRPGEFRAAIQVAAEIGGDA